MTYLFYFLAKKMEQVLQKCVPSPAADYWTVTLKMPITTSTIKAGRYVYKYVL